MSKVLADFKVNPGRYNPFRPSFRHYYRVRAFVEKKAMWAVAAKLSPWEKDQDGGFGALTMPKYRQRPGENDEWIISPKIGDLLFCKDYIGSEVISHESVHAATSFLRILGKLKLNDQIDDDEELLAHCVGSIMRQIVQGFYDAGAYG